MTDTKYHIDALRGMLAARTEIAEQIAYAEAELQDARAAHRQAQVLVEQSIADESPDKLMEARGIRTAAEVRASDAADQIAGLRRRQKSLVARIAAQGHGTAARQALDEVNAAIMVRARELEALYKEGGGVVRAALIDAMALTQAVDGISVDHQRAASPFVNMQHLRLPLSLTEPVGPYLDATAPTVCLRGDQVAAGAADGHVPDEIMEGLATLRILAEIHNDAEWAKRREPVLVPPLREVSDHIPSRIVSLEPDPSDEPAIAFVQEAGE